jgi:hypothetical protein
METFTGKFYIQSETVDKKVANQKNNLSSYDNRTQVVYEIIFYLKSCPF